MRGFARRENSLGGTSIEFKPPNVNGRVGSRRRPSPRLSPRIRLALRLRALRHAVRRGRTASATSATTWHTSVWISSRRSGTVRSRSNLPPTLRASISTMRKGEVEQQRRDARHQHHVDIEELGNQEAGARSRRNEASTINAACQQSLPVRKQTRPPPPPPACREAARQAPGSPSPCRFRNPRYMASA